MLFKIISGNTYGEKIERLSSNVCMRSISIPSTTTRTTTTTLDITNDRRMLHWNDKARGSAVRLTIGEAFYIAL